LQTPSQLLGSAGLRLATTATSPESWLSLSQRPRGKIAPFSQFPGNSEAGTVRAGWRFGIGGPVNEKQLRRLFQRLVLLSAPLPMAFLGAACGGTTTDGGGDDGDSAGTGGTVTTAGTGTDGGSAGSGAGGSSGGSAGTFTFGGTGGVPNDCTGTKQVAGCMPVISEAPRKCLSEVSPMVGEALPSEKCQQICGNGFAPCSLNAVSASTISVTCQPGCAVGRRPAGLGPSPQCDSRAMGDYFAEIAHLEAASVTAFRILRDELRATGAPKKLVRAAARAARDEIRHARTTSALTRRFGGTPQRPRVARAEQRTLEAMAIENAVEGCVRETFGALLATRQATLARDPAIRAAMVRIARDETQHASLSWRVARFLNAKLDADARRNVERAKRAAADELLAALASEPVPTFADLAGLPSTAEALRLASEMKQTLWS
jgi:hypothetical protein